MADIGQKLDTLTSLDSALSCASGGSTWVNGTSRDIGANSSPQATVVPCQFSITNAGSTNGHDLDVLVQFSDDDTNWPDNGNGLALVNFYSSTAGADLTRSQVLGFRPLQRYFRFHYRNNNGTDALSVSSETGENLEQSA